MNSQTIVKYPHLLAIFSVTLLSTLLVACGSDSSSSSTTPASTTLTGTAATGAAIAGGTVTARCVNGTTAGTTAADGSFTLSLNSGQTPPCMIQVTKAGPPLISLYSYATATGHVNITPMTDMVLAKALGTTTPDAAFAAFSGSGSATAITSGLAAAKTYVQTQITATGLGTISGDLLTGALAVGDSNDHILDALGTALTNAGKTNADLRTAAAAGLALTTVIPPANTGNHFTAATAYPFTGIFSSLAGNYDSSLSACKTGVPTDPNSFLPDFSKGTTATNQGFSVDINGAITFAGATDGNYGGDIHVFNNGSKQVVFNSFTSGISLRSDTTAQNLTQSKAAGTTGCIIAASTVAQFRNAVDPSTRLKKIFGNGLSLLCGNKQVRLNTEGQISVNNGTPVSFDFATENTSTFFPSSATYVEQLFTNENGSASKQFGISLFMPVTLGDGTLAINVDSLNVTDAILGATACTAGT